MKPIVLIVVLSGLVLGGLVSVNAGSLGYRSVSAYMDWDPDCSKPSQPSFFVTDVDCYNYAVSQFNGYLSEVQLYISCISNEAGCFPSPELDRAEFQKCNGPGGSPALSPISLGMGETIHLFDIKQYSWSSR